MKQALLKNLSIFSQTFTKVCLGFAVLMAGFAFILFDLTKVFDLGLLTYIWLFFLGLLAILGVASLIYVPFQFKNYAWNASVPFVIVLTLALSISPLITFRTRLALQAQKPDYEKIIRLVESGALQADSRGYIEPSPAPSSFIYVDKNSGAISLFYDLGFSIVTGSYTGFMYRSDDTYPPVDIMSVNQVECERAERNWFYCWSLY